MSHNPLITNRRPDAEKFLLAAFALALIGTIEADEKEKTARWCRARAAHDPIIRICDTYLPNGINHIALNQIWDVIDGPVMESIRANVSIFNDALGAVEGASNVSIP